MFLFPTTAEAEMALENVSKPLGLKKRKVNGVHFVAARSHTVNAIKTFNWFVRKSWRSKEFSVLWAIINIASTGRSAEKPVPLESVAELSCLDAKTCSELIEKLLGAKERKAPIEGFSGYKIDPGKVEEALAKLLDQAPSWTEELVMDILCSRTGASVADIYSYVVDHGLSVGAVYKIVERLKREGYVVPIRYFRVNPRGPMRELLAPNCRNCFYGYTSEERCFQDTFRQLEALLQKYYGRRLGEDERASLYKTLRSLPYSSRALRRTMEALRLLRDLKRVAEERSVAIILKKLQESYGMELQLKAS